VVHGSHTHSRVHAHLSPLCDHPWVHAHLSLLCGHSRVALSRLRWNQVAEGVRLSGHPHGGFCVVEAATREETNNQEMAHDTSNTGTYGQGVAVRESSVQHWECCGR